MPEQPAGRLTVAGHRSLALEAGWELAGSQAGAHAGPATIGELEWIPAQVPGTVAGALAATPAAAGEHGDLDAEDWWFRVGFERPQLNEGEELWLCLGAVATVSETYLNGRLLVARESMFAARELEVGELLEPFNELAMCCRALAPLLEAPRRPRARWRTRLADGGLRFQRTMLMGRAPGFAPGPPAIGPWRGVALESRARVAVERLELRPRLQDGAGVLSVSVLIRSLGSGEILSGRVLLDGPTGHHAAALTLAAETGPRGETALGGELLVDQPALWWPHTHGEPVLYEVGLELEDRAGVVSVAAGRTGFRTLDFGPGDPAEEGIALRVNGAPVFARGAVWTPLDLLGMAPAVSELRETIETARAAGMNMLRIPGTASYETAAFHDLCDELGMMVWQDLMFANFDYPIADAGFRATVEAELEQLIAELAGRPSLTVVCGNSEVEQQVAMLGQDPALGRGELFGEIIPRALAAARVDGAYIPSAPCGGELPFRPDRGVANYYGVGGYRRPLEDARRSEVRFAAECLAFSNVPDERGVERLGGGPPALEGPLWKAGVPRDVGADWDFEDVRDHYLGLLFGLDPVELRAGEPERYLELSRAVTGEVMAEVFGEWRRAASPCGGALVLWLRDLMPGAGWGVLDEAGRPKPVYHHLRRALAPVAVWTIDEGLGGVVAHLANDGAEPLSGTLRVAFYSGLERKVEEATTAVELAPHSQAAWNVETLIGRFADASWAYRFGPPAQDAIVLTLHSGTGAGEEPGAILSQAFRFPAGRPLALEAPDTLGLVVRLLEASADEVLLAVGSARLAYGVRIHGEGFEPVDDCFSIEPGGERTVRLLACGGAQGWRGGHLTALNLRGRVPIAAAA